MSFEPQDSIGGATDASSSAPTNTDAMGVLRLLKASIGWLVALACITYIIVYFIRHRADLNLVLAIGPQSLVFLALLHFVQLLLNGYRVGLVLQKCSETHLPVLPWLRVFLIGRLLSQVVPQMGTVYRGRALKARFGVSYTRFASGWLAFGWLDVCLNTALALLLLVTFDPTLKIASWSAVRVVFVAMLIIFVLPIALHQVLRRGVVRVRGLQWMHAKVSEAVAVSVNSVRDWAYMTRFVVTGILSFALMCVIFSTYLRAMGVECGLSAVALFAALLKLSNVVNVTPGNWGVREMLYGVLGANLALGMSTGMLLSLLIRIMGNVVLFALIIPLGGFGVLRQALRGARRKA